MHNPTYLNATLQPMQILSYLVHFIITNLFCVCVLNGLTCVCVQLPHMPFSGHPRDK